MEPGNYVVIESKYPDDPCNVSDYDTSTFDKGGTNADTTVDSSVGVIVEAGEVDDGNDFVNSDNARISGTMARPFLEHRLHCLKNFNSDSVLTTTTTTDRNGKYVLNNLEPPGN